MSGDPVATASGSDLFGFADFCAKPRGTVDSVAIASGTGTARELAVLSAKYSKFNIPYAHLSFHNC